MSEFEVRKEETRESWQEQERKINSLGTIKEIVNSKSLLLHILIYSGDRHLINQFYDMLNDAIEKGEVLPEDLEHLRSGWLGDCIVKLDAVLETMGREAYPFEKGDKLNYTTNLRDTESQIATFTNPRVIAALAETTPDRELKYCEQSLSSLSIETRLRIAEKVIRAGNLEKGLQMISEINKTLSYERISNEKKMMESQGRK